MLHPNALLENSVYILNRYSQLLVITKRQAMYYKSNIEALSRNHCCRGKLNCYIFCVSVALVIRLTKRIDPIILLSVAGTTLPYFSTLSHNWQHSKEKKIMKIKCVSWFSLQHLSEIFLIRKKKNQRHKCLHVNYSCWIFRQIFKKF